MNTAENSLSPLGRSPKFLHWLVRNPAFWLALLTFSLRLFALLKMGDSRYHVFDKGDMKFYNDWALRILDGRGYEPGAFYGLPGYAYFLAGIYSVIGFDPFTVGLLQSLSDAIIVILIFTISLNIFEKPLGPWVGIVAGLGWAFFLPSETFSIVLMPTTWLALAFWGTVLVLLKTTRFSYWRPWLPLGLLFGAMAMMIATILLLLPLVIFRVWWVSRSLFKTLAATVILLAGTYAGMSPCWIHNYFYAHEPVLLSAHSGINFYIGNNPVANGYPKIPPGMRAGQEGMLQDSKDLAAQAVGHPLTHVEVSQYWSARAKDYIHSHPGEWLDLMAKKFRNFWNRFQYDDLSLIVLFREAGILLPGLGWGEMAALALPGLIYGAWRFPKSRWVLAAVALHLAALMPVFVTERYRLAAAPGLLIFAALAVVLLWEWLSTRKWTRAGGLAMGCLGGAWFVSLPVGDSSLWALDYYNVGIKALDAGDLAPAQKNLETAYGYVRDNDEINFALGNLWLQKGDDERAKQFYRHTIEINPRHDRAYNNLAVIAMDQKYYEAASGFLARSINIDPTRGRPYYLLARARQALGDLNAARLAVQKAHSLEPDNKDYLALFNQLGHEVGAKP